MTHKSIEEKLFDEWYKEQKEMNPYIMRDYFLSRMEIVAQQQVQEAVEDAIKMSDQLESDCNRDGDKGTKQWMAFKGFRNTLRDKYLSTLQSKTLEDRKEI